MSYTPGSTITLLDYDTMVDAVRKIYANGTGDFGYGQSSFTQINPAPNEGIKATHWNNMRGMITTCAYHQGDETSALFADPSSGGKILAAAGTLAVIDALSVGRLEAIPDAYTLFPNVASSTRSFKWNGVLQMTLDVDFQNEDQARYFFNSGGTISLALAHNVNTTALDTNFRDFLKRQIGTFSIRARGMTLKNDGGTTAFGSGYYGNTADDTTLVKINNSANTSQNGDDYVEIHVRRTGYLGERGGNGSGFQVMVRMRCMGSADGSTLSPGTSSSVSITRATRYLFVAAPNCATSGFSLLSSGNGNSVPGDPTNPTDQGGVIITPEYNPQPGTREYIVPDYATITFELRGGGGSEGPSAGQYPRNDGANIFLTPGVHGEDATINALGLVAHGGVGGGFYNVTTNVIGTTGANGDGSGGDVNTTGGGGTGGKDRYVIQTTWKNGAAGGAGAYVKKTYVRGAAGAPAPGTVLTLTIPSGGSMAAIKAPTSAKPTIFYPGADGANGQVKVTYTATNNGSINYTVPGAYQFTVPKYSNLKFKLSGGGGGQAHALEGVGNFYYIGNHPVFTQTYGPHATDNGFSGGDSSVPILNVYARGGSGGTYTMKDYNPYGLGIRQFPDATTGANGVASGGSPGKDQTGAGAQGGYKTFEANPIYQTLNWSPGGAGGNGGYTELNITDSSPGAPVVGQVIVVNVGAGGSTATVYPEDASWGYQYGSGDNGYVSISWDYNGTNVDTPV